MLFLNADSLMMIKFTINLYRLLMSKAIKFGSEKLIFTEKLEKKPKNPLTLYRFATSAYDSQNHTRYGLVQVYNVVRIHQIVSHSNGNVQL